MFSGIVEELGSVHLISRRGNVTLIQIIASKITEGLNLGDSIAVNGVCLTLVGQKDKMLSFEAMPQTLKDSNLKSLRPLDKVNLEKALKFGDRVSGHLVNGHVHCEGLIRKKGIREGNTFFQIFFPQQFIKYVSPKGSIAVDGISLTIMQKLSNSLFVYIIPHTLKNTTLSFKGPSDKVNLEFDMHGVV
ncbi:MAG: riboflavin synthase [Candidatus Omnitrophica bacterium]|jgi:riboflavin synthase|nr:riboflavin synthase [Candidatus Omnitrophota bacterium]